MKIINLLENKQLLKEYIILCSKEWGSSKTEEEYETYANQKLINYQGKDSDNLIAVLGLVNDNNLIGFISLFKKDAEERKNLTPWYATMYVKQEYRKNGYSKILNNAILEKAKELGYNKVYLKTELINYYEKFGAKFKEVLNNKEKLYYIDLTDIENNNII